MRNERNQDADMVLVMNQKITAEDYDEIRALRKENITCATAGRRFGISATRVSNIWRGKTRRPAVKRGTDIFQQHRESVRKVGNWQLL